MSDNNEYSGKSLDRFLSQVNLTDLALFVQLSRHLNLSKAAGKLGMMTESTASRRLRRLEQLLGGRLFERTTRSMILTETGEVYLHQVRLVIDSIRELHQLTEMCPTQASGNLKLGVGPFIAEVVNREFIGDFMRKHPEIMLNTKLVTFEELNDAITELDLVVISKMPTSQSIGLRNLMEHQNYFWVSSEYLKRHGQPKHPRDLANHCVLMLRDTTYWGENCIPWKDKDGTIYREPITHTFYCDTANTLIHLVTQGVGILLAPPMLVRFVRSDLEVLFDGDYGIPFDLYAIFPTARLMPAKVAIFLRELEAYIKYQPNTI